ncbi:MAG: family 43 glycosylhydrolase [Clostridia bacterium]|nr:family 43 glycosylhydrolase [Clostridia bacterium]
MLIPKRAGEWKILFRPEKFGRYVNDHCILRGADGRLHMYGITSHTDGDPRAERYFVHAAGDSMEQPMAEIGKSIDHGTLAWAPCVIKRDADYYMFYGPSPTSLAVSPDMHEWFGYAVQIKDEPPMAVHRDHFVLEVAPGEYLMYVVGIREHRSAVSLLSSHDLLHWQFEGYALTSGEHAEMNPAWGAMESPFVVKQGDLYYLFITYTNCSRETYNNTMVFVSHDPRCFGEYNGKNGALKPVAILDAHAPEIIFDNGKWYITTCGWPKAATPHPGCLSVAPLVWEET